MTLAEPQTLLDLVEYARSEIREIDVRSAFATLEEFIVIDVREADEILPGYLPNAVHIPRGQLEFSTADHPWLEQKDRLLLLYSNRGLRSALAAYSLALLGYSNVASLRGGFAAWQQVGLPIA